MTTTVTTTSQWMSASPMRIIDSPRDAHTRASSWRAPEPSTKMCQASANTALQNNLHVWAYFSRIRFNPRSTSTGVES